MSENKKRFYAKVTKTYSRKVGLRGITSQYDNIDRGTFVTAIVGFKDENEFKEKCRFLSRLVTQETEEDIAETLQMIKKMANDENNQALVGLGPNMEAKEMLETDIDGLADLLNNLEDIPSGPVLDLEEADDISSL